MSNYIARGRCDICYVADGAKHHDWCEFGEGIPDCPQCARFREKLDREKMAKVAKKTRRHFGNYGVLDEEWADAFIAYLTE